MNPEPPSTLPPEWEPPAELVEEMKEAAEKIRIGTPIFPISNESGEWWAFSKDLTPREVIRDLIEKWDMQWYLEEETWIDDDDNRRGCVAAYRKLLASIKPGHLRPYDPARDFEYGEPEWWFKCEPTEPSVEAWLVDLR